jgi:hypothetical protein
VEINDGAIIKCNYELCGQLIQYPIQNPVESHTHINDSIMTPDTTSTAHFINPSPLFVGLFVYRLGSVNRFPRQGRIVAGVVLYAVRVM